MVVAVVVGLLPEVSVRVVPILLAVAGVLPPAHGHALVVPWPHLFEKEYIPSFSLFCETHKTARLPCLEHLLAAVCSALSAALPAQCRPVVSSLPPSRDLCAVFTGYIAFFGTVDFCFVLGTPFTE